MDSADKPVSPTAPEPKNAVTASPRRTVAGTITGLKRMKSGVMTSSPIIDPTRVRPARARSVPPTGRRVITAITWEAEAPEDAWPPPPPPPPFCGWTWSWWCGRSRSRSRSAMCFALGREV
ncbi:hypothetical protein Ancab_013843 [Ancistrocladus abbreviatus]